LVVGVGEVGPFDKELDDFLSGCVDEVKPDAGAEQVIAGGIGLGAVGGKEVVLRVVMVKPDKGVTILIRPKPFA